MHPGAVNTGIHPEKSVPAVSHLQFPYSGRFARMSVAFWEISAVCRTGKAVGISQNPVARGSFLAICAVAIAMYLAAPAVENSGVPTSEARVSRTMAQSAQYDPHFWIFGSVRPDFMPEAKRLGFFGVGYWGADRDGDRIKYYFSSPTLEKFDWAERVGGSQEESSYSYAGRAKQGRDLASYTARAHAAGLKVMVNMEGVNPYHWEAGREKWTPEIISAVATDLHDEGADRWFTECVAGWPPLFKALADTGRRIGLEYQEGDDPGYLHFWEADGNLGFPATYSQASLVSMYHYHYRRDEMGKSASLAQEGTLAFGFARGWGHPMALVYTVGHDWGELPENWEGILKASILIRALQFRVRDIMIIGENDEKARTLDVAGMTRWAQELVTKNAQEQRPVLNVVAHLRIGPGSHWHDFATSGDAITSGAFHSGYDVVSTTEPLPDADAYYVYTAGADDHGVLDLTPEIAKLFDGKKPVFLQIGGIIPSGDSLTPNWRSALVKCGVNADGKLEGADLPATGVYNRISFRYTGVQSAYALTPRQHGTRLPQSAVTGTALAEGDGASLIVGNANKYIIPANCISWQMMYPIGHLLSGSGALSTSDVWGIAGAKVSALLAIHDTALDLTIPGLKSGAKIRVRVWDRRHEKTSEDTVSYTGSYQRTMKQFDFVLIEAE
jgi:hypothetical protein